MVRIKTLLLLMVISAVITSVYFIYIRDGAFDTIKDNYLTPNKQITNIAEGIRKTCDKWNASDCYVLEVKKLTEKLHYANDTLWQTIFQSDNDVNYTLKNGNDCDGFAVFSASLLHQLNVKYIYVLEEKSGENRLDHVSIGVRTENGSMIIIYSQKDFEIGKIRRLE